MNTNSNVLHQNFKILRDFSEDVLVLEKNLYVGGIIEILLRHENYTSFSMNNGHAAIELVDNFKAPKIVILDTDLHYTDGYTVLKHIRNNCHWKHVPVVMLSTKSHEKDIVKGFKFGANDYVLKPFIPGELMVRLQRLVKVAA